MIRSSTLWDVYSSAEDASVNFTRRENDGGLLEARFVQRVPEYFIAYLSSHTGCNKSCRMCHLTATGQTTFTPATVHDYEDQVLQVLSYYNETRYLRSEQPKIIHYNWMARGEPLANEYMLSEAPDIFHVLDYWANELSLVPKFKISTIMPEEMADRSLMEIFKGLPADIYYSMYSLNPRFRTRFLPKSIEPDRALEKLAEFQTDSGRDIRFHWPFIDGENDSLEDVQATMDIIKKHGIYGKFNLVRYNPPNDRSRESSEEVIYRNFELIKDSLGHPDSRIVPRVGFDVKASCGMFMN